MFWLDLLQRPLPIAPAGSDLLTQIGYILLREGVGIIAVLAYLFLLPPIMAVTIFRKFYLKMGFIRFLVLSNLLLFMAALPIKMLLRWTVTLKYIVAIPEWFLNI